MSARSNINATRNAACRTGSRIKVAPVIVIVMPGYEGPINGAKAKPAPKSKTPTLEQEATEVIYAHLRAMGNDALCKARTLYAQALVDNMVFSPIWHRANNRLNVVLEEMRKRGLTPLSDVP